MPFVRSSQIAWRSRSASYSSTRTGNMSANFRHSVKKPGGMSSASPPAWK